MGNRQYGRRVPHTKMLYAGTPLDLNKYTNIENIKDINNSATDNNINQTISSKTQSNYEDAKQSLFNHSNNRAWFAIRNNLLCTRKSSCSSHIDWLCKEF
jgi:hypothetical protein